MYIHELSTSEKTNLSVPWLYGYSLPVQDPGKNLRVEKMHWKLSSIQTTFLVAEHH